MAFYFHILTTMHGQNRFKPLKSVKKRYYLLIPWSKKKGIYSLILTLPLYKEKDMIEKFNMKYIALNNVIVMTCGKLHFERLERIISNTGNFAE